MRTSQKVPNCSHVNRSRDDHSLTFGQRLITAADIIEGY